QGEWTDYHLYFSELKAPELTKIIQQSSGEGESVLPGQKNFGIVASFILRDGSHVKLAVLRKNLLALGSSDVRVTPKPRSTQPPTDLDLNEMDAIFRALP